jgi:AcrR family transcriptional regulator
VSTPRRRSSESRAAILAAAYELLLEKGLEDLTVEGIAARAGVGKQTIYRWWPSKGAVAVEAFAERSVPGLAFPDTGDLGADLGAMLTALAVRLADPEFGPHAAALMAGALHDPALARTFREVVFAPVRAAYLERVAAARRRGELRADVSDDDLLDAAFGPLWFLRLNDPDRLTAATGATIARIVLDGARAVDC